MKLRNKKTREIADVEIQSNCMLVTHQDGRIEQYYFDSIKDLEEWEDYEEPKENRGYEIISDFFYCEYGDAKILDEFCDEIASLITERIIDNLVDRGLNED